MTASTETERAALLPCPFCGEPAEIIRHGVVSHVRCRQWACGCHGSSTFEYSTEEAIISWNRRAPASPEQMPEPDFIQRHEDVCGDAAGPPVHYYNNDTVRALLASARAVPESRYRLLERGVDTIQPGDEFLQDDGVTWRQDPNGLFVGMTYHGNALLPARRAIAAAPKGRSHEPPQTKATR